MRVQVEQAFEGGRPFGQHLALMQVHRRAFEQHYEDLGFVVEHERRQAPFGAVRVLVLTEDFCVDSMLNLPLVARLAEASPESVLKIASRNRHAGLAAEFPGRGGMSRLPTVIFLGAPGEVLGYWSERSAADKAWMDRFNAADPMPDLLLERGRPTPKLAAWMGRRIQAQAPLYREQGWRVARDELVETLARGRGEVEFGRVGLGQSGL